MTPIGQHFLIHFIYSPLWPWNTEHLENLLRREQLRLTSLLHRKRHWNYGGNYLKEERFHFICYYWTLKKQSCQISVLISQHPSCAHPVPCVITPREWLSRCEGCGWDWIRRLQWVPPSLDNWCLLCFGGICAAPVDRAAPHLLPNISCLFFLWSRGPPLQPVFQVSQVHEKAHFKLFSPPPRSWTLKISSAGLRLICYLGHPLTPMLPGLLPLTLSMSPYLGALQRLANCKTHRQFIIPSLFAQTKHWAHIWSITPDPFILF